MPKRAPDLQSPGEGFWKAWQAPLVRRTPDHAASLAGYILFCPGAHPFWSYWMLTLIHLRDIPGVRPAHRQFPRATHEILIAAINPEQCPSPNPDAPPWPFLTPFDLVEQFEVLSDADAQEIALLVVRTILSGHASPDQDYRAYWRQTIQATALHYQQGKHPRS